MRRGRRPCYYEVLGVARDASTADIITAYIKKLQEWRLEGDSSTTRQSRERLQQIEEAYQVLSDVSSRATYDANVARQHQQPDEYNANDALESMNDFLRDIERIKDQMREFKERMKQKPEPTVEEIMAMLQGDQLGRRQ